MVFILVLQYHISSCRSVTLFTILVSGEWFWLSIYTGYLKFFLSFYKNAEKPGENGITLLVYEHGDGELSGMYDFTIPKHNYHELLNQ